jgi:endonuclease/exonuclease/phosphatase family metal-dependent hydrolase
MTKVKIGTFNVENLFNRYKLLGYERGSPAKKKPVDAEKFVEEGGHINMLGWSIDDFGPISKSARRATAAVILENKPDIVAIQEVENLFALLAFNQKWLKNAYPYAMVIDGNDLRQIDVGILSKYPIINLRTHRFEPAGSTPWQRTFSRDCFEADLGISKGKMLTVLVNHFKSKIGGGEEKRRKQAERVSEILKERFGNSLSGNFVVAGDLNNHYDASELQPLLSLNGLENVVKQRLPKKEHWTHYYNKGKAAEQLDYLLLSPELSEKNTNSKVHIERRGLPTDIKYYEGDRFEVVTGKEGASDHCGVFISLEI